MAQARNRYQLIAAIVLSMLLGYGPIWSQTPNAPAEVRIPFPPIPVVSNGQTHLVYELHITNFYRSTGILRLNRVDVMAGNGAAPIVSHEGADLARSVVQPGASPPPTDTLAIPAGLRAVVYLWVTLPTGEPLPTSLRHRLFFRTEKQVEEVLDDAQVALRRMQLPVLGPPFRAGIWFVANGPGNIRSDHWGGLLAANGRVTIPQRFALDLMGLDADGKAVRGDYRTSTNKDWVGYRAEALAIADGIVREIQDGMPDKVPLAPVLPTAPTYQASGGNYIVLDLGHDIFVYYAHFQSNSVTVRPSDRVRRGQVLGRVGNSGSTNAPHLHLHVSDAQILQGTEGLPFVFESFESLGETSPERALGADSSGQPSRFAATRRVRELPLHGAVIRFR